MNLPETLFHYTSPEGLLGIMNGAIWASQIQYMNDAKEWHHAIEVAQSITSHYSRSLVKEEAEIASYLSFGGKTMSRTFVVSLTEEGDLLSQWRGYCAAGGYSLGFKPSNFLNQSSLAGFQLRQCIYADDEKEHIIEKLFKKYVAEYAPKKISNELKKELISSFMGEVRVLAEYFKHASFAEEKEWRLVGTVSVHDKRGRWRTRGNLIIPYTNHDIDFYDVISEIIIGPKVNEELADHSIKFMSYGHVLDIKVSKSTLV